MVRDRGHALSIEIEEEKANIRVRYFIPKVCNIEKVNNVRGVDKLDPSKDNMYSCTKGEFVIKRDKFTSELIEFINSIPTDSDMEFISIMGGIA